MRNEEKETKRGRRQTATAPPSIGNKGDTATATTTTTTITTSDCDHHQGRDVAESLAAIGEDKDVDVLDVIEVVRLQHHWW